MGVATFGAAFKDFDATLVSSPDGVELEGTARVESFDVQDDQGAGVESLVRQAGYAVVQSTPIVTMRIKTVAGRTIAEILTDTTRRSGAWALRREYRSTYRDTIQSSERVVAGRWFGETPARDSQPAAEVSLEQDVAKELRVKVGDVVVWDVQGVEVPTRVTSFRDVNWARFEPNFFAVFAPVGSFSSRNAASARPGAE